VKGGKKSAYVGEDTGNSSVSTSRVGLEAGHGHGREEKKNTGRAAVPFGDEKLGEKPHGFKTQEKIEKSGIGGGGVKAARCI